MDFKCLSSIRPKKLTVDTHNFLENYEIEYSDSQSSTASNDSISNRRRRRLLLTTNKVKTAKSNGQKASNRTLDPSKCETTKPTGHDTEKPPSKRKKSIHSKPNFDESGVNLLQDTFVCFDDTQTLINKSKKTNAESQEYVTIEDILNSFGCTAENASIPTDVRAKADVTPQPHERADGGVVHFGKATQAAVSKCFEYDAFKSFIDSDTRNESPGRNDVALQIAQTDGIGAITQGGFVDDPDTIFEDKRSTATSGSKRCTPRHLPVSNSAGCTGENAPKAGSERSAKDKREDNFMFSAFNATQFCDSTQVMRQIESVITLTNDPFENGAPRSSSCNKENMVGIAKGTDNLSGVNLTGIEDAFSESAFADVVVGSGNGNVRSEFSDDKENVRPMRQSIPKKPRGLQHTFESRLENEGSASKKIITIDDLEEEISNAAKMRKSDSFDEAVCKTMHDLFKSSQYRKEVELMFEKVETTICELGPSHDETLAKNTTNLFRSAFKSPDFKNSIREILKSTQVANEMNPETSETFNNIDWNDDSLLTDAVLNMSAQDEKNFASIIRKTLLENAHRLLTPQNTLNATVLTAEPAFTEMGGFYGLPNKVKDLMKAYRGIEKLYAWQDECLNLPAVKSRRNLVYALPTSGGKTLVAEILILREILCRKRNALFVLPFVAIVQEKVWSLSPFAVALDFLVEEYAAGKGGYPPRRRRRKNAVYIATIEKAVGLINSLVESGRLGELGLVVIDELHLIGDQSRGPTLEALLTKLMFTGENVQIVGMSATIGNLPEVCRFLNAEVFTQNFRPVELVEYVKCGNELAKINWNAADEDDFFTFVRKVDFGYSESLSKLDVDRLGGLVMEVVPKDSCLIFCSSKKNCENVAYLLCRVIFAKLKTYKTKEKSNLMIALKEESGNLCEILSICIPFGVAYHHSGLTSDERRLIEEGFRAGTISVICCTSTLAAGVNLPAKRVILRQPYIGREFINLSRYKQMVGRAGRAGLGELGESILVTNSKDLPKVRELLMSPMDQALSNMHEDDAKGLRHLLLSCISLGIANTRAQLQKVAHGTLLGVQREKLDVDVKKLTDRSISGLFKLGALKVDDGTNSQDTDSSMDVSVRLNSTTSVDSTPTNSSTSSPRRKLRIVLNNDSKLVISKLGSAAIKGGLELTRAHLLYEDLLQAQASLVLLDCLHLLYLVTPYDISQQIRPSKSTYYNLYMQLRANELQTAKILGINESVAVKISNNQPIKNVPERVLNRFYVTLMLYDLWNGVTIYQVAEKYEVPRGLVQNLMTSAATFASNVVNFCSELEEFWAFAHLLKGMSDRLQHCCVRELMPLMDLPAVKQSRAKQLYNAGYKSLASIAKADPNELVERIEFMSRRVANQLIAASKLLLLERVENLREEAEDVLDGIEQPRLLNFSVVR